MSAIASNAIVGGSSDSPRCFHFPPRIGAEGQEDDERQASAASQIIAVVTADRRGRDRMLARLALAPAASGLLLLAATALVVPRVLRRELAPLVQLANQSGRLTADSLTIRFPTRPLPAESAPFSARLNNRRRLDAGCFRPNQTAKSRGCFGSRIGC